MAFADEIAGTGRRDRDGGTRRAARRRQPGRRSSRGDDFVQARDVAGRSGARASTPIRGGGSRARKICWPTRAAAARRIAGNWPPICAPWPRSCGISSCWRHAPTTAGWPIPTSRPALDRLTPTYQGARGIRAFAAVDRALEALERNAGVKIVADWLVLEL